MIQMLICDGTQLRNQNHFTMHIRNSNVEKLKTASQRMYYKHYPQQPSLPHSSCGLVYKRQSYIKIGLLLLHSTGGAHVIRGPFLQFLTGKVADLITADSTGNIKRLGCLIRRTTAGASRSLQLKCIKRMRKYDVLVIALLLST